MGPPAFNPVASPLALMDATLVGRLPLLVTHATTPVRSCVELSEYVPTARYACVKPTGIEGELGVTAMDCNFKPLTFVRSVTALFVLTSPPPEIPALNVTLSGAAESTLTASDRDG
jgi:hypothetical protein